MVWAVRRSSLGGERVERERARGGPPPPPLPRARTLSDRPLATASSLCSTGCSPLWLHLLSPTRYELSPDPSRPLSKLLLLVPSTAAPAAPAAVAAAAAARTRPAVPSRLRARKLPNVSAPSTRERQRADEGEERATHSAAALPAVLPARPALRRARTAASRACTAGGPAPAGPAAARGRVRRRCRWACRRAPGAATRPACWAT